MTGRFVSLLSFVVLLSGCVSLYEILPPGRTEIGKTYTVDSQIEWSRISHESVDIWTVDGPWLETVQFFKNVGSGDTLFQPIGEEQLPVFDSDMRSSAVVEFVVDSWAVRGANDIKTFDLRPAMFGTAVAFRFDLQFFNQDGLLIKGMVLGAIINNELQLIIYTAPATHYFEKYRATVENVFNSVELI